MKKNGKQKVLTGRGITMNYQKFCVCGKIALIFAIFGLFFTSCPDPVGKNDRKTLVSIAITTSPTKTTYTVGESLALSGLVVTAVYSDNSTAVINNNELTVSGFDSGTPGSKTITVSYGGKTAAFTVMVNPAGKSLTSILITSQPAKTAYTTGESLALTGLVVTAVYSDGSTVVINNNELTVSGFDSGTPGSKTITVSYGGKTAAFTVMVNPAGKSLTSILITSQPAKTAYTAGESLILTGLAVTAVYSDGSTAVINNNELTVSGFDSGTPGSKTVTVSYGGKSAAFTVMVNQAAKTLVSITITTSPTKTTYAIDESLVLTGLAVTAIYSDGSTAVINNNELTVSDFDSATPGSKTVTVSYDGKTAAFTVMVNQAGKSLTSILITSQPAQTTYTTGESLVLTGLVVTAVYSDGSTTVINNDELAVNGFDSVMPGSKTITVSYGDKSADFTVTVNPVIKTLISIHITSQPAQTTYAIGESLVLTGLVVTAVYSDGSTTVINNNELTVSGFDSGTPGSKTVTVSYGGKSADFTVTVTAITLTVTFNPNGGNWDGSTANKTVQADWNTTVTAPDPPSREFHIFINWYKEAACINVWTFTNEVTTDITLYAQWGFDKNALVNWIGAQPGGANASAPVNLSLQVDLGDTLSVESGWRKLIDAIYLADKYVNLDLSACTMNGTTFSGSIDGAGADKIVNIVLPNTATSIKLFMSFDALKSFSGAGLTSIGDRAFFNNSYLALTSLPAGITSIDDDAFYGCRKLALTSLPAGLTSIGDRAFQNCINLALTSLPAGLTSIGDRAFQDCINLALTSLPAGLTSIGKYAFFGCTNLALTSLPVGLTSIGEDTFYECTNLALTSLPAGLTSIGDYAFYNCTNLALTSLPAGLTSIGWYAFYNCTNLALTSLPAGLTSIWAATFLGCTKLTQIELPSGITFIGVYAFSNCTNLALVTCRALTPPSISGTSDPVFNSTHYSLQIKVPAASVAAYKAATGWSQYASKISGF